MAMQLAVKRVLKRIAGCSAVLADRLAVGEFHKGGVCILVYHRVVPLDEGVGDSRFDDWNVTPGRFEEQMVALSKVVRFIPLPQLVAMWNVLRDKSAVTTGAITNLSSGLGGDNRPLVAVTFDDGYLNFRTRALPILKRLQIPATVFVVTSMVGTDEPMHFDPWTMSNYLGMPRDVWASLGWDDLDVCLESGLVSVGSHSHQHLDGSICSAAQLVDEAGSSWDLLQARLGDNHSKWYAYPFGNTGTGHVNAHYVEAVRNAGYAGAVTTNVSLADWRRHDLHLLPRVEAAGQDTGAVLKAKVRGCLAAYRVLDRLKGTAVGRRAVRIPVVE